MTLDCSPYLRLELRSRQEALDEMIARKAEMQAKRMPLADNEDLKTDVGTYGRDDIDATLPLVTLAKAPVQRCKDELEAIAKLAEKNGRAGKAAFGDPVEWISDALEDLQTTERAFADALRADEERG